MSFHDETGLSMAASHLLLDGWNLLYAWGDLVVGSPKDGAAAAGVLVARVQPLLRDGRLLVTIVFDGQGKRPDIQALSPDDTFNLIYTPSGTTADAFIERAVGSVSDPQNFIVATGDHALRMAVFAMGADVISPENLAAWIERAAKTALPKTSPQKALSPFDGLDELFSKREE
ncbi:MAG: NYN domain-containing protein [Opitutales bacterium]|nr:NYN domain-containing protein [Opitutales bacterium]